MPQVSKVESRDGHNSMHDKRVRERKLRRFDSIFLSGVRRQRVASAGGPIMKKLQLEHIERLSIRLSARLRI